MPCSPQHFLGEWKLSQKPLIFRIARLRSGTYFGIPDSIDDSNCGDFSSPFTIDEQVDILCLTECLNLRFERQEFEGVGLKGVTVVNRNLRSRIDKPPLSDALIHLGLHNSANYVHFGERLLQW